MKGTQVSLTAVLLVSAIPAAHAQSAPAPADDQSGSSEAARADNGNEIVVTAQRRSQRLEEVPASVVALSGERLAESGVSGISNIAQTVPGLAVYRAGGYVQPAIRGVTTTVVGTGAEANVAIYVDGFYMPNQTGNVFDFANIAQVEVLKGPQGTLFGRNATGGALTIRTLEPSRDTSVRATATYGSFDDRRVSAYATTGLTNTLTADISFYSRRSDGWTRDVVRNVDATPLKAFQVRTKLQWTPTDNTKITAAYEHLFNSDATGLAYIYYPNGIWRKYAPTLPTASEPNTVSMNFNPLATARIDGAYLTAEQRFGAVTFKSLTMYRLETDRVLADLDGSTLAIFHQDNTSLERTVTQEFDLSGKIGRFDWIVGGFYYNDHFLDPNVVQVTGANNAAGVFTTTSVTNRRGVNSESFAGFVDGTYGITDHLFLTAGARYTTEYKAMEASRIAGAPRPAVAADHRWNSFTPRAAIRWEVAPRTDLYASYSRGFKSGNFNAAGFDPVPVNPEEISAYEVGVHTATRRTRFNASGFYYNYSNVQFSVFDFGQSVVRLINAAGATVYGADAEVTTSPTENLDLRASAAWTHARYDSFPGYPAFVPIGNNTGNNRVIVDLAGYRVFRSPDWKANVGATWRIPSPIGEFSLSSDVSYQSETPLAALRTVQGAYVLVNARASWKSPDDRLTLSVFSENLTDRSYLTFAGEDSNGDRRVYGMPRYVGVSLGLKL